MTRSQIRVMVDELAEDVRQYVFRTLDNERRGHYDSVDTLLFMDPRVECRLAGAKDWRMPLRRVVGIDGVDIIATPILQSAQSKFAVA